MEQEKKQYVEQIQKLVRDIETAKILNKEHLAQKQDGNIQIVKSPGDKYDQEDVVELDSEKVILNGKSSGFRRDGPQAQPNQIVKCSKCGCTFKEKKKLEEHMKQHKDLTIKCKKCSDIFNC